MGRPGRGKHDGAVIAPDDGRSVRYFQCGPGRSGSFSKPKHLRRGQTFAEAVRVKYDVDIARDVDVTGVAQPGQVVASDTKAVHTKFMAANRVTQVRRADGWTRLSHVQALCGSASKLAARFVDTASDQLIQDPGALRTTNTSKEIDR